VVSRWVVEFQVGILICAVSDGWADFDERWDGRARAVKKTQSRG